MITDVRIIHECINSNLKHYRLAVETYGSDMFTYKSIIEILPCAPSGEAQISKRAIIKAYKAVGINIIK